MVRQEFNQHNSHRHRLVHCWFHLSSPPDPYTFKITYQFPQQVKIENSIQNEGCDPYKQDIEPECIDQSVTNPFYRSIQVGPTDL
jgi:hypothetical protein